MACARRRMAREVARVGRRFEALKHSKQGRLLPSPRCSPFAGVICEGRPPRCFLGAESGRARGACRSRAAYTRQTAARAPRMRSAASSPDAARGASQDVREAEELFYTPRGRTDAWMGGGVGDTAHCCCGSGHSRRSALCNSPTPNKLSACRHCQSAMYAVARRCVVVSAAPSSTR